MLVAPPIALRGFAFRDAIVRIGIRLVAGGHGNWFASDRAPCQKPQKSLMENLL
jgi:hypothetical protein